MFLVVEFNRVDILKDFFQMRLDSCRLLGLRQYLQEVVIRQEVKPRKFLPLLLQIFIQRFLNILQLLIRILKLLQQPFRTTHIHHLQVLFRQVYIRLVHIIDRPEFLTFSW